MPNSNQLQNLSPRKNILAVYCILTASLLLIFYQLWGVNIISADDPYLAMASFRGGGILNVAMGQAQGQGRYFFVFPMTLTQLAYIGDSVLLLSAIRVVTNLAVFIVFFKLVESIWGRAFALLCALVGVGFFDCVGGSFNSFYSTPLTFTIAAFFIMLGFWSFNENCKENRPDAITPFLYYFIALNFYESIVFYMVGFILIYFSHKSCKPSFLGALHQAAKDMKWLFLLVAFYLIIYAGFRFFYPSMNEGNKELNFPGISRLFKTVWTFSVNGIYIDRFNFDFSQIGFVDINIVAAVMAAIAITYGILLLLRSFYGVNSCHGKKVTLMYFVSIGYFIFAPNLLYGMVDKYHSWADAESYYVGSYFSAFPHIILLACTTVFIKKISSNYALKHFLMIGLGIFLVVSIFSNYKHSLQFFYGHKIENHKWILVDEVLLRSGDNFLNHQKVCEITPGNNFLINDQPFHIYNYWSSYFSKRLGRSVEVLLSDNRNGCDWIIDEYTPVKLKIISGDGQKVLWGYIH